MNCSAASTSLSDGGDSDCRSRFPHFGAAGLKACKDAAVPALAERQAPCALDLPQKLAATAVVRPRPRSQKRGCSHSADLLNPRPFERRGRTTHRKEMIPPAARHPGGQSVSCYISGSVAAAVSADQADTTQAAARSRQQTITVCSAKTPASTLGLPLKADPNTAATERVGIARREYRCMTQLPDALCPPIIGRHV